jgi:hypothetical protein
MISYDARRRCYRLAITLHDQTYTQTFKVQQGKRATYKKAERYEHELLQLLQQFDRATPGKRWQIYLEIDARFGSENVCCGYRDECGRWRRVSVGIDAAGLQAAMKLAVERAKGLHCPETASTRAVRLPLPHSVRLALRAFE